MVKLYEEKLVGIVKLLEGVKVFTLDWLVSLLGCSTPSTRLKLKQWNVHTSYNQNGRYYAMPAVPMFDDNGLWFYENVAFSKYGNLRNTIVALISNASFGLTGGEIGALVRLAPRSFLHHFRDAPGIHRQKQDGVYVYFSENPFRLKEQIQQRALTAAGKLIGEADAIAILVALIKRHGICAEDIADLPEMRSRKISVLVIREFMDRHGLLKKTLVTER